MDDYSRLVLVDELGEQQALIREGLAREVLDGVLVAGDVPVTPQVRVAAVSLKLGRREVDPDLGRCLGFATAAWVATGVCPGRPRGSGPARIDLVVGRHRRSPRLPGLHARQIDVPGEHLQVTAGVLVTRPVRTAADLARDLPEDQALPALRSLQELADVHPPQVLRILAAMRYARGAAAARAIVRSWAEMQ